MHLKATVDSRLRPWCATRVAMRKLYFMVVIVEKTFVGISAVTLIVLYHM